jgi:hypothetical protein
MQVFNNIPDVGVVLIGLLIQIVQDPLFVSNIVFLIIRFS